MPGATVEIRIDDDRWRDPRLGAAAVVRAAAAAVLAGAGEAGAGVSVLLTGDDAMARLNARWRGRDRPTNVLSFPAAAPGAAAGDGFLGDIALAFGTLAREAAESGVTLADHLRHMTVHGLLHLLGYDHGTDGAAREMERRETEILRGLGVADPWAGDDGAAAGGAP